MLENAGGLPGGVSVRQCLKAGNKATHKQHAYFIKGSGTSEGGTVMGAWHLCKTQARAGGGGGQSQTDKRRHTKSII